MSFTHGLATNRYGEADLIVDADPSRGTHITLASAMAAATSGQTIFLRTSVTENVTITPGVNISAWQGSPLNTPSITGTLTMTGAGTSTISGINLITNSNFAIAVTGSAASILYINNCYLNCTNNTGVSFTSSSASSTISMNDTGGNLATTGIALFAHSGAGTLSINHGLGFANTGNSTTANTISGTGSLISFHTFFSNPTTTSSTATFNGQYTTFLAPNATAFTHNSTTTSGANFCAFNGGTGSAISIGAGATLRLDNAQIISSNTNIITGSGTLVYGILTSTGSSNGINVTTLSPFVNIFGFNSSTTQPAFLATHTVAQNNVTGNATVATVNFTTEIFDQSSSYNGTNTFTAPITGRYQLSAALFINDGGASTGFGLLQFTTSNRNYVSQVVFPFAVGQWQMAASALADMDAADTCIVQGQATGVGADTADYPAAATQTYFGGFLAC